MATKMICILSYDITNNKRRRKIVKELEGVARRVQYSVFESWLTEGQLSKVIKKTERHMEISDGDSLLIYRLCRACSGYRERLGGEVIDWEESIIID